MRRGGFSSWDDAERALERLASDSGGGSSITVRVWLERWLASRVAIRAETRRSYRELIRNYLIPYLGALLLAEVRTADVQRMFTSIIREHEYSGRVLSPATLQRIHAVARCVQRRDPRGPDHGEPGAGGRVAADSPGAGAGVER
jgi:hypothetical protein